ALGDLLPELEFHRHDRVKLSAALLAGLLIAFLIERYGHGEAHVHPPAAVESSFTISQGGSWSEAEKTARESGYELGDTSQLAIVSSKTGAPPEGFYIDLADDRALFVYRDPIRDAIAGIELVRN